MHRRLSLSLVSHIPGRGEGGTGCAGCSSPEFHSGGPERSAWLDVPRQLSLHFVMVVQEGSEERVGTNGKEEERVNGAADQGDEEQEKEENASDSPEEAELELDR